MNIDQSNAGPRIIGRHLLADLYGVESDLLTNKQQMLDVMLSALHDAHFNVVNHLIHRFPGENAGVTAIALLSESHATFHTYPEHGYVALDIFSCGSSEPEDALSAVVKALRPERVHRVLERRGDRLQPDNTDSNETPSAANTSSAARLP